MDGYANQVDPTQTSILYAKCIKILRFILSFLCVKDDFSTFIVHALDLTAFPLGRLYTDVIFLKTPYIWASFVELPCIRSDAGRGEDEESNDTSDHPAVPQSTEPREPQNHLTTNESMLGKTHIKKVFF